MILDLRRPAAASESGRYLPHQEGAQDGDAPEDLDGDEPVAGEPVAEVAMPPPTSSVRRVSRVA